MTELATPAVRTESRSAGRVRWKRFVLHGFLIVMAVVWLFPILWTLFTALRPYGDVIHDPVSRQAMVHTVWYVQLAVSLELVLGILVAVTLHRVFRGRLRLHAGVSRSVHRRRARAR